MTTRARRHALGSRFAALRELLPPGDAARRDVRHVLDARVVQLVTLRVGRDLDEALAKRLFTTLGREKIQTGARPDTRNALGLDHPRTLAGLEPREVARCLLYFGGRGTVGDGAHDVSRLVRRVPRTAALARPKRGYLPSDVLLRQSRERRILRTSSAIGEM